MDMESQIVRAVSSEYSSEVVNELFRISKNGREDGDRDRLQRWYRQGNCPADRENERKNYYGMSKY